MKVDLKSSPPDCTVSSPTSSTRLLVVLFSFADSVGAEPYSREYYRRRIFTDADSVACYFKEVSFGKYAINEIAMTDWIPLPFPSFVPSATDPAMGDLSKGYCLRNSNRWSHRGLQCYNDLLVRQMLNIEAQYHITRNDSVVYIINGMWEAGIEDVGNHRTLMAASYYLNKPYPGTTEITRDVALGAQQREIVAAIAHEIGHHLGFKHANNCVTTAVTPAPVYEPSNPNGTCLAARYGDKFDVMGNELPAKHFGAWRRSFLGWISPGQVKYITTGALTQLEPIDMPGNGFKELRIPHPTSGFYSIEYRKPIGPFDGGSFPISDINGSLIQANQKITPGVYIRWINQSFDPDFDTIVLSPVLTHNTSYIDPIRNIKISVTNLTSERATLLWTTP